VIFYRPTEIAGQTILSGEADEIIELARMHLREADDQDREVAPAEARSGFISLSRQLHEGSTVWSTRRWQGSPPHTNASSVRFPLSARRRGRR
jgi:hypothetical protein